VKYLAEQALGAGVWDVDPRLCDGRDFTIHGVAPGAFTVKGARQTAYLYTYCFFRPGWNQGLVIVQGNEIVAHYAFTNLASSMYALKDINRNGMTELALEYGFTGRGTRRAAFRSWSCGRTVASSPASRRTRTTAGLPSRAARGAVRSSA
jgi:hypothetical protein